MFRNVLIIAATLICEVTILASWVSSASELETQIAAERAAVPQSQVTTSGPRIYLSEAKPMAATYKGPRVAVSTLATRQAEPLSIASGDFDGDGIEDLAVGYGTAQGGVVALHRANHEAFAPETPAGFAAISRGEFLSPFLSRTQAISIPISPDFVSVGSFSVSGQTDLVVGSHNVNALYVFAGDGKGNFAEPQIIDLPGTVTAMAGGGFGNAERFDGVIVAVSGPQGASLQVYKRAENGLDMKANLPLNAAAATVALGDLDGDGLPDAAVVSGNDVFIMHGASMQLQPVLLPDPVAGLALGAFVSDRNGRLQMALLGTDGSIELAAPASFDARQFTVEEIQARWAGRRGMGLLSRPDPPNPNESWQIIESYPSVVASEQRTLLFRTRISSNASDDLMLLDQSADQLVVISHGDAKPGADWFTPGEISTRPNSGSPVAAVPMRVNVDGRPGLVTLNSGQIEPSVIVPLAVNTYNVTGTGDTTPIPACTGVSPNISCPTLRGAIQAANANPGTDTINIPAGTYTLALPRINGNYNGNQGTLEVLDSVNIVGAGQATTIIQGGPSIGNGVDMVLAVNEDITSLTNATASISNLTIKFGTNRGSVAGFDGDGGGMEFDTGSSGNANLTLTNVTFDSNKTLDGNGSGLAVFNESAGPTGGNGLATLNNCIFTINSAKEVNPGATGSGGGMFVFNLARATVNTGSQFTNNTVTGVGGGIGIFSAGSGSRTSNIHGATFTGNHSTGDGGGIWDVSNLVVDQGTVISGNTAGGKGGGIFYDAVSPDTATFTKVTISGNTATGNGGGIGCGEPSFPHAFSMSFSRVAGNNAAAGTNLDNIHTTVTATNNWWGTNTPAGTINSVSGTTTFDPFIALTNTPSPSTICVAAPSTLTASFLQDNHGTPIAVSNLDVLLGLPITFNNAVRGTLSGAQATIQANGQATATFTANAGGAASADAVVDSGTATAAITVPTSFTSAASASWTSASTWTPQCVPQPPDTATIINPHNVTLPSAQSIGNLTINSGGTLTNGGNTLSVSGSLTNNGTFSGIGALIFNGSGNTQTWTNSGTGLNYGAVEINHSGAGNVALAASSGPTIATQLTLTNGALSIGANTLTINGGISAASGTLTGGATSNITFGGAGANSTLPSVTNGLNNLIINRANGINLGGNLTINGTLTLTSGAFAVGSNTLTLNNSTSVTSGSLTSNSNGTVNYNQSTNGQSILAANYGNLTFSNNTKVLPNGGTVGIAGTFTTGAAGGHTLTGSTVEFNGSSAQVLPSTFPTYNNLTLNNAAGTTGFAGLTIQGVLHVQAGTFTSSSSYNNVQIDGGTTLAGTNATTINVSGNWNNDGAFNANGNTVSFNGNNNTQTLGGANSTTFANLIINHTGTGGASLGNGPTVSTLLTLTNGALTLAANTLTINGAISTTSGTLTGGPTSNITFGGAGPSTTLPSVTNGLGTLVINRANGILLGGNLTVNTLLTLTSGDLNIGANTLTMPASATSGPATNATDAIGNVKRTGLVTGACPTAPCANTLSFGNPNNQITITSGTAPTDISVNLVKSAPVGFPGAVLRTYTITPTGGSGITATLRLHYLDSELNGNVPEANLNFRRFNGTGWAPVLATAANTGDATNNWLESNAVTTFSPWTFSTLTPTAANGVVSGRIVADNGVPVEGAVVRMDGTQTRKTITDSQGSYRFDNVETNGFYTVTPARANYIFRPSQRSFSALGSNTEATFSAAGNGSTVNPLDTSEYFVRQQYLDFLGREPDEGGFNFWSDQVLSCGTDLACVERKRINVSAAFFLSIEFQQSGGLVDRLYRVSYGRRPLYGEFTADTESMTQTVVGQTGWQLRLEASKAAFVDAWIQRPAFHAVYDALSDEAYMDKLIANTGVGYTTAQRGALISGLTNGALTRARVLQRVAEDGRLVAARFNEEFVLMEYFGYLRRDPDEAGCQFWLGKLNQFNGNIEQAEMVKAFINSTEYRQRFPN